MICIGHMPLWFEVAICIGHIPPWYTFEFYSTSVENVIVYRAETLGALANVCRLYLLWWIYTNWMLADLPNRHTVAHFAKVKFGSMFALKRALNSWNAIGHILGLWVLVIIVFGYFYRCFEMTSCQLPGSTHPECARTEAKTWFLPDMSDTYEKHNDPYMWNSCWFIFITMTTVGYGDITPNTHLGRIIATSACFCGLTITACGIATSACFCGLTITAVTDSS
ncbi:hypothetical protein T484DRAFT_1774734 [Baffinella frigidus]|nr:hypothetical protein T484DRAFT_1774734 [Cryptophyta sp. CCMP2293]